ncbi:hypothetical protein VTL71DRAFT_10026 [Oculimacula yallundae]|uniref:Uncharacterized protein n=1 Tax=Oculimacula yallundae TaxID=86028 RepID=A0ABR4BRL2_9HELO
MRYSTAQTRPIATRRAATTGEYVRQMAQDDLLVGQALPPVATTLAVLCLSRISNPSFDPTSHIVEPPTTIKLSHDGHNRIELHPIGGDPGRDGRCQGSFVTQDKRAGWPSLAALQHGKGEMPCQQPIEPIQPSRARVLSLDFQPPAIFSLLLDHKLWPVLYPGFSLCGSRG